MAVNVHSEPPAISFKYDQAGGMTVAVVGQEVMYEGVFDKERVEAAVCRLGLRLKDRASLYLDAVDRCQDRHDLEVSGVRLGEGPVKSDVPRHHPGMHQCPQYRDRRQRLRQTDLP